MYKLPIVLAIIICSSCSLLLAPIIGDIKEDTQKAKEQLSRDAKELIDKSFKGLNLTCLADTHTHAIGNGSQSSGNWVNPSMKSMLHPFKKIQYNVYLNASGVKNENNADYEYIQRLIQLLKAEPRYGKALLLAFDYFYNDDGTINKEHSTFYISNEYIYKIAKKYPQYFIPVISIHPSRKDSVAEVKKWGEKGVNFIKWLPNGQGIDASNPLYKKFYQEVIKQDMVIITHTGHEKAVDGEEYQKFGNPWRFKKPLDMGVKFIMSHVASLGDCQKLHSKEMQSCFKSFTEVFRNPKYKNNLFADLSGINIHTRVGESTNYLLSHPELADRLINGSDYPLPAINFLYRTSQHRKLGHITKKEEKLLDEIYHYNPLIFDFVLKRTMAHPKTGEKLRPEAFTFPKSLCKKLISVK